MKAITQLAGQTAVYGMGTIVPRLLNYLTAPNVLIRHAALASAAIPGIFPAVQLRARNFEGWSLRGLRSPSMNWMRARL